MFGVEQGWETNRVINYKLINSRGITVCIRVVANGNRGFKIIDNFKAKIINNKIPLVIERIP